MSEAGYDGAVGCRFKQHSGQDGESDMTAVILVRHGHVEGIRPPI